MSDPFISYSNEQTVLQKVKQLLGGKANSTHTHQQSDITGLSDALAGKAAAVHTHVCTDITDLETKLNQYAKKTDISTVYKYKGSCTWAELIAKTDATVGDTYNVADKDGMNYACIVAGTAGEDSWDALGVITQVNLDGYYTIAQIQANYYDKSVIDSKLNDKADASTVSVLQTTVNGKADSADVYLKTETYNRTEIDAKIPRALTSEEMETLLATLD